MRPQVLVPLVWLTFVFPGEGEEVVVQGSQEPLDRWDTPWLESCRTNTGGVFNLISSAGVAPILLCKVIKARHTHPNNYAHILYPNWNAPGSQGLWLEVRYNSARALSGWCRSRFTGPESLPGVYLYRNPTVPTGAMAAIQLDFARGSLL